MATVTEQFRLGEARAIFAEETAETGTLTIQASPAPMITLYGGDGQIVSGWNGIACTGYDTGAAASRKVWHLFATAGLAPGYYVAMFAYDVVGNGDGIVRKGQTPLTLQVLAPVEVIATYDPAAATPKDIARLCLVDTDTARAIWSDVEINLALGRHGNVPELGAAMLLDAAATDAARQAKIIRLGTDSWDRTRIADQLRESAKRLRETATLTGGTGGVVIAPDAVFTMTTGSTLGTMAEW